MIKINKKSGFTLVEMLIAVSIFAVVATLASSMFSTFANNQKRAKVSQELLNNAQYALEIISREVKNNELIAFDNSVCASVDSRYAQCLLFARENGEAAGFFYDATDDTTAIELDYLQLDCLRENGIYSNCQVASAQTPAILLSEAFNQAQIIDLDFLLTPNTNPYFGDTDLVNQQPRVTINMIVRYPSVQPMEQATHHLQTTVSSRVYKR